LEKDIIEAPARRALRAEPPEEELRKIRRLPPADIGIQTDELDIEELIEDSLSRNGLSAKSSRAILQKI